jgi:hypothetical protein
VAEFFLNYENFFECMAKDVPEVRPLYEEHLRSNEELLPHVLLADEIIPLVIDLYKRGWSNTETSQQARDALLKILQYLERGIRAANKRLVELVCVSFLEHLDVPAGESYEGLKGLLGPRLLEQLKYLESWRPGDELEKWGDYPYDE